jgi:hypothetical protein
MVAVAVACSQAESAAPQPSNTGGDAARENSNATLDATASLDAADAPEAERCLANFGRNDAWSPPSEVAVEGYGASIMEPKLSADQGVLLWNDKPPSDADMAIHYAVRRSDGGYQYVGPLSGVDAAGHLDGVPAIDRDANLYFVSLRNYASDAQSLFAASLRVPRPSILEAFDVTPADDRASSKTRGIVDMDVDVSWDGRSAVVSRARFDGAPYPSESRLVWFDVAARSLSPRADSDTLLARVNHPACRVYAASLSDDGLELFFTVLPSGMPRPEGFYLASARRASTAVPFETPALLVGLSGDFIEGPTTLAEGSAKTLYFHRFDAVARRFKLYRSVRRP